MTEWADAEAGAGNSVLGWKTRHCMPSSRWPLTICTAPRSGPITPDFIMELGEALPLPPVAQIPPGEPFLKQAAGKTL